MEQFFRFYTWQLPEWDVTTEKRDPSKGPQAWEEDTWKTLELIYAKLEKKIGPLDFLWCFAKYEYWPNNGEFRLWELDVPSSRIEYFFASNIWESLFHETQINKQCGNKHWDQLFIERDEGVKRLSTGNTSNITPLIHVPLLPSIRVVNKERYTYNTRDYNGDTPLEKLPTSIFEAKKYRNPSYFIEKRRMRRLRPKKG